MLILIILAAVFIMLVRLPRYDTERAAEPGTGKIEWSPFIYCRSSSGQRFYHSLKGRCSLILSEFGNPSYCGRGCVGAHECVDNCPSGAISESHIIDYSKCIRCGLCIEICPAGLIRKTDSRVHPRIKCIYPSEHGTEQQKCSHNCVSCYLCISVCRNRAIILSEQFLPVIDGNNCTSCLECVKSCPTGTIVEA